MNAVLDRTRAHLAIVLGPEKARSLLDDCLREVGLEDVHSADELHRLGTAFMKRGGFLEVVGRFLRVQAITADCGAPRRLVPRAEAS